MNSETQTVSQTFPSTPEAICGSLPLCSNISPKGRRCRQPVTHLGAPFCRTHSRIRRSRHIEANPLTDLPADLSSLNSYSEVTLFLARVLTLLSENRISPRRAAVLTYIANSILNSLRAAERQALLQANDQAEAPLQIDWSAMTRIEPDPPPAAEQPLQPNSSHSTTPATPQAPSPKTVTLDLCPSGTTPGSPAVPSPNPPPPASAPQPPLNPPPELFHSALPPRPVGPMPSHQLRRHWDNRRL